MSKMSKAIAVLGVVAGLGVAALPLSSYAASSKIEQAKVQVDVGGSINLTLASSHSGWKEETNTLELGTIMIGATDPAQGTISALVETNDPLGYSLSIKALNNAEMVGSNGGSIESNTFSENDTKGWAYKVGDAATWTALTTSDVDISASDSTTKTKDPAPAEGAQYKAEDTINITFGVKADSTVAEGTYTGTVVLTAAVN